MLTTTLCPSCPAILPSGTSIPKQHRSNRFVCTLHTRTSQDGHDVHRSAVISFRYRQSPNRIQTQRVCSNPSKYPERLRKARTQKCGYLQAFCKLQKPLAKYLSALAWRRSRVRVSSGSLLKFAYLCGIRSTSRRKSNLPLHGNQTVVR